MRFLAGAVCICIFSGAVLGNSVAQAATEHVYKSTFGEACSATPCGPSQFSDPAGIAVNDATSGPNAGDVYVVDKGDDRVEWFNSTGAKFEGEFSGLATPAGAFSEPEGIAIDNDPSSPSYQDVYVADTGNGVVDKFSASGSYLGQLTGFSGSIYGIAVDPSGMVWVYQSTKEIADFSDAEPNVLLPPRVSEAEKSAYPDFAVDSEDNLYVAHRNSVGEAHVVAKLNSAGKVLTPDLGGEGNTGIAVDLSDNDVYLDTNGENLEGEYVTQIEQLDASGSKLEDFGSEQLSDAGGGAVAVSSTSHDVYVADTVGNDIDMYEAFTLPVKIDSESVASVQATSVTFEAEIDPGETEAPYHFEYGPAAGDYDVSVPVPDAHTRLSKTDVTVSALAKGLAPSTTYHYRVVAVNSLGEDVDGPDQSFTTNPELGIEPTGSCPNEQRRAEQPFGLKLPDCRAYEMVSPVETGGTDATESTPETGPRAAASGEAITYASAGSFAKPSGAGIETQYVSRRNAAQDRWETQAITPLHDPYGTETAPSYRGMAFTPNLEEGITNTNAPLVAGAAGGKGVGESGLYLADFASSSYRYIAPEHPIGSVPLGVSSDLSHVVFGAEGDVSEWVNGDVVPVGVTNEGEGMYASVGSQARLLDLTGAQKDSWQAVSSDGSRVFLTSPAALQTGVVENEPGQLYVRVNAEQAQSPIAEPEVEGTGDLAENSDTVTGLVTAAGRLEGQVDAGSSEVNGVETRFGRFVVGETISGPGIEVGTTITNISGTTLTLSIPTTESEESGSPVSGEGPAPFTVGQKISGNGIAPGTTITEAKADEPGKLTLSKPAASSGSAVVLNAGGECTLPPGEEACTIEVSASQRQLANPAGTQAARYWGASADGSKVFFTSNAELTEDAYTGTSAENSAANLYEYDLETGKLNDLTGEKTDKTVDGAAVQGVVQISEEGQYVYFVAKGALTGPHGEALRNAAGAEPVAEEDNLYVSHEGGAPAFIATLSADDESDWGNGSGGGPELNTAVVSPGGGSLAFVSGEKLKTANFPEGYDNEQAQSGECEQGKCSEVFLYDAGTGRLVCASCDPSGARPLGPSSFGYSRLTESLYRDRNLLEDGTLFFDSSDALVPHASDGRQNVYEYEEGHVYAISNVAGGFESFFLDSGPGPHGEAGGNVFFGTADQLLPQDTSNNVVVYDARIDGGFPVTVAAPPCTTAEACRTASPPTPSVFGAPPSATFSGPGNVTPPPPAVVKPKPKSLTRAQKLAAALKTCHKDKKKAKRQSCEKQARTKYGPVKPKKTKKSSHSKGSK